MREFVTQDTDTQSMSISTGIGIKQMNFKKSVSFGL